MDDDSHNVVNSTYHLINEIQSLKIANKSKSLSMFHINACSLNKNFGYLKHLIKFVGKTFVAVTDIRITITRNTSKLCNISLKNFAV